MLAYLKAYARAPFAALALTDVDLLIFSQLAYLNLPDAEPGSGERLPGLLARADFSGGCEASEARFSFQTRDDRALARAAMDAARYADIRVLCARRDFRAAREKQFALLALLLPDGQAVLAFRGTDNTLAGWKEDANLCLEAPVPAQTEALRALCALADGARGGPILLCGHSKGGNLALYAGACAPEAVQARIARIVSFDGPGLTRPFTQTDGYARVRGKIRTVMPRGSLVGQLFERADDVAYIKSRSVSVLQHYPYFWKTSGTDFVSARGLSPAARFLGACMRAFLSRLSPDEKRAFTSAAYRVLRAARAETLQDLLRGFVTQTPAMLRALRGENRQTYLLCARVCAAFWKSVWDALAAPRENAIPGACYCGHDCARCKTYLATARKDGALRAEARRFYAEFLHQNVPLSRVRCRGGRSERVFYLCADCPFAKCCREKGISACDACETPCDAYQTYREKYVNRVNQTRE